MPLLIPCVFAPAPVSAAEIYNKEGNKLVLYGLVSGLHYFNDDKRQHGDQSCMRIGFEGQNYDDFESTFNF